MDRPPLLRRWASLVNLIMPIAGLFKKYQTAPHSIIIAAVAFIAYSNSFHVPFLFDDIYEIVENMSIRSLERFIFEGAGYAYNPNRVVSYFTIAINYKLGGLDVTGYHLFNLITHIANSFLVYLLVLLVLRTRSMEKSTLHDNSRYVAFYSSLIFVVHPIQTQAVTYIVQRMTSLATLFYLSALCSYVGFRLLSEQPLSNKNLRYSLYVFAVCASIIAMKTKEFTFTLPVMIILSEFIFFEMQFRYRVLFLIPFGLCLFIIPVSCITINQPVAHILSDVSKASRLLTDIPRSVYLVTQACVVNTYIRLIFFPIQQNLDYDYPLFDTVLAPRVLGSIGLILFLVLLAIWFLIRGKRYANGTFLFLSFGILWFFVALSVESSFVPIVDVVFEHRVYLPSIGAFMAVVAAALGFVMRCKQPKWNHVVAALGILTIMVFGFATYHRNSVWADSVTLWRDVVEKSPGKGRPRVNLGVALARRGMQNEAIEQFQKAVDIDPSYAKAYTNLGAALAAAGRVDDGIAALTKAISLNPANAEPYYNLGRIYLIYKGAPDAGIEAFSLAIRLKPNYVDAHVNLAAALNEKRRFHDAIQVLSRVGTLVTDNAEARANLAIAYYGIGNLEVAGKELEHVRRTKPHLIPVIDQKIQMLFGPS